MSIIHWLVSAAAILIAAQIIPGVEVTLLGAAIAAVVIALINVFIKPVILLLTLPLNIVTLGLFSLVINALLVMLASAIVPEFDIVGFWPAFLFAIVISLINWLFGLRR